MQSGRRRGVVDAYVGAQVPDEAVERLPLGGPDVGRGHDPQPAPSVAQPGEWLLEEPQTAPHDERTEQVDVVCAVELGG